MPSDHRYVITLTSSQHMALPKPRVLYRETDHAAIDAAERELRFHRHTLGDQATYDGWRLRRFDPGTSGGHLVAEVRPGYDSRKVAASRPGQSGAPPF